MYDTPPPLHQFFLKTLAQNLLIWLGLGYADVAARKAYSPQSNLVKFSGLAFSQFPEAFLELSLK